MQLMKKLNYMGLGMVQSLRTLLSLKVEAAVEARMEKAYQFALESPLPDPADVLKYNYACDNERSVVR